MTRSAEYAVVKQMSRDRCVFSKKTKWNKSLGVFCTNGKIGSHFKTPSTIY